VDEKTLEGIPGDREFAAIGAGEKQEKQPHPLIMEEPFWIYAGSGVILVLGGLLKVLLALNFLVDIPDFGELQEYSTLKNIILGIIFLVCGIIILRQKRDAGWVVISAVSINLVIASNILDNEIGFSALWKLGSALFDFIIFGLAGLIPLVFGLKRGMKGKY
jgi:glucose dehydrogenase